MNKSSNQPKTGPHQDSLLNEEVIASCGLRVTCAQLARLLDVTRPAVSAWKKAGRIVLGPDGRCDPRAAVASLLRSGDPARLRSRILEPVIREAADLRSQLAACTVELDAAREAASFHEGASQELLDIVADLLPQLRLAWRLLASAGEDAALAAIASWLDEAMRVGRSPSFALVDLLLPPAPAGDA